MIKQLKTKCLLFLFACLCTNAYSQSLLKNTVTLKANKLPLHDVLTIISNESNITFSYNTKVINRDSLVTLQVTNKPLGEVLRMIFDSGYEFKESGSYIIIRRKPLATSGVVSKSQSVNDYYIIDGYVVDDETGEKISDATIYEKQHLISSMTDAQGYFSLRLKNKFPSASISVSKAEYNDTSIIIQSKYNQKVNIAMSKKASGMTLALHPKYFSEEEAVPQPPAEENPDVIEDTWIGRVLLSSKQRIRSLNLKKFYTTRTYQFSLVPGISTHGKMNAQVVNKTSINVIGGYSGGVDLFEVGTVFNLVKKDVKMVQLAGVFNIVGGKVKGLQVASVYNQVQETMEGVQISGLINNTAKEVKGLQIATLYNSAKSVKGMQIGFINRTHTQEGTSIGLINISKNKKGKNKVGFILRLPRKW